MGDVQLPQSTSIRSYLPTTATQWGLWFSCLCLFVGFTCSRALMSIGVIGMIATGLYSSPISDTLRRFATQPIYWVNSLIFCAILLSGINSTDTHAWLNWLRIALPFLLLPIAYCGIGRIEEVLLKKILTIFGMVMWVSGIVVTAHYFLNYEVINETFHKGGGVPTPFSHIRYNMLLAFSCFCLLWLWQQAWGKYPIVWLLMAVMIFIMVHILSSRSGWVTLYAGMMVYIIHYIFITRQWRVGIALLISIALAPVIAYHTIPSFHERIGFVRYAWQVSNPQHIDYNTDAERTASIQVGIHLIQQHPLLGTGVGDLMAESRRVSTILYPYIQVEENRKMPHNQWIWIGAGAGLLGLLLYALAFFVPAAYLFKYGGVLPIVHFVFFFLAFLVEYPIEEQVGASYYLVFLLLFINRYSPTLANDSN